MTSIRLGLAAAMLGSVAAAALAQPAAPSSGATATSPPPATSLDRQSGSLSKKLGRTNGVIKPRGDVDPDMHVGTPRAGTMPVIKPGQTGGGIAK